MNSVFTPNKTMRLRTTNHAFTYNKPCVYVQQTMCLCTINHAFARNKQRVYLQSSAHLPALFRATWYRLTDVLVCTCRRNFPGRCARGTLCSAVCHDGYRLEKQYWPVGFAFLRKVTGHLFPLQSCAWTIMVATLLYLV